MNQDLQELQAALAEATRAYEKAKQATSAARKNETSALNRVNGIQSKIDAVLVDMRKAAPPGSDWATTAKSQFTRDEELI